MYSDLQGKRIAILGGNKPTREIVAAAKELGMYTIVVDYNPPELSPAKVDADQSVELSLADTDAVAAWAKDNHIDGIITGYTDSILKWYAEICDKAGLPSYGTAEQFELFTDKHKWKALFKKHGVPTAEEYEAEKLLSGEIEPKYPLFVKPAQGSGARGTAIACNREELEQAIANAQSAFRSGDALVEDYLEGPEITVFWLFVDGEFYIFMLGNRHVKHNQEGVIPLPAGYTFPAGITPDYLRDYAPALKNALRDAGVKNGMMFMQCIVKNDVPYVYDVGFRTTGSQEQFVTEHVAGFNVTKMLLNFAVTGKMTDGCDIESKVQTSLYAPAFNISLLMKPGTIDHFEGLDKVENDEHVLALRKSHYEGETLQLNALGQLRQIVVRVLGVISESESMGEIVLALQNDMDCLDGEGKSLILPGLTIEDFRRILPCSRCRSSVESR